MVPRSYEAKPMVGIEHAPLVNKAWMVVEVNTEAEDRIDHSPHIICWSFQGRPEQNEIDARLVADALNGVGELETLFDMQHTRVAEATALWREAHPGNELVLPDLGRLVGWLLGELRAGAGG